MTVFVGREADLIDLCNYQGVGGLTRPMKNQRNRLPVFARRTETPESRAVTNKVSNKHQVQ